MLRYQSRLSGPFLNRIDMQIEVPAVSVEALDSATREEGSAVVAERVLRAFERQIERQGCVNAHLSVKAVEAVCGLDDAAAVLLGRAMAQLNWSARIYHRILRVARTIADMEAVDQIGAAHVAQAIQYRRAMPS